MKARRSQRRLLLSVLVVSIVCLATGVQYQTLKTMAPATVVWGNNETGVNRIFLRRHRKAGSTTIFTVLGNVRKEVLRDFGVVVNLQQEE